MPANQFVLLAQLITPPYAPSPIHTPSQCPSLESLFNIKITCRRDKRWREQNLVSFSPQFRPATHLPKPFCSRFRKNINNSEKGPAASGTRSNNNNTITVISFGIYACYVTTVPIYFINNIMLFSLIIN